MTTVPTAAELLRQFLDALEQLDADRCVALLADDAVVLTPFAPPGLPTRSEGRAAFEPLFRDMLSGAFASFELVEPQVHAMAEADLAVATAGGRIALRAGGGFEQQYVVLARTRDGRIAEYREYFNPLPLMQAMGAAG